MAESTPFLGGNHDDDYDGESHPIKVAPANSHFKRPLKTISALISFLSIGVFGLLIAAYVLTNSGPFNYIWSTEETLRDLAIVLFVNFLVTVPTLFLQLPIILNIATQFTMAIVTFVFSGQLLGRGWPDSSFCHRYSTDPNNRWKLLPETYECKQHRIVIQIMVAVGAGVGIFIGLLFLSTVLLRLVALVRTRFWQGKTFASIKGFKFNPSGFTMQFTLSVLPAKQTAVEDVNNRAQAAEISASGEQARLIET